MRKILFNVFFLLGLGTAVCAQSQIKRLGEDLQYKVDMMGTFSDGQHAPFWFTSNRYGLGTTANNSGYVRAGISRQAEMDNAYDWRFGYGADIAVPFGMQSPFVLQQLYADVQWKALRLSIGQKECPLELKNQQLSSGALTSGINARPLPQIRLELPDFLSIPGTKDWLAIKAHLAYGAYTDNQWQREFNDGNTKYLYSANSLYHSKAGFLRVGNVERFPISLTGGIEMSCQFGGEAWNLSDRADHAGVIPPHQNMGHGFKQFWQAFIPGGSDANDGDYHNVSGNQLGSWHLSLDYQGKGWKARAYAEHFFDDHSQMFWQYPWKDMLYGIEVELPKNPVLGAFLYEYIRTDDQSGSIYRDATPVLPEQISAIDNYYNNHVYGAWQHAGFIMSTPLVISPLYNNDNRIFCYDNRLRAHHFGLSGNPCPQIGYRVLFTHERSLGTYLSPHTDPRYGNFLLLEVSYNPSWLKGLQFTASYGQNGGQLLGRSHGGMLTVSYNGWINPHKSAQKKVRGPLSKIFSEVNEYLNL